ncbi:MAG: hypothetical protein JSU86_16020 [Phycisphaerales bacterium]|nr:MAG: hypothetical protein JSU86_16020 [Phycisphaerales bacterium]
MRRNRANGIKIKRVVVSGKNASIRVERLELSKDGQRRLTTGASTLDPVRKGSTAKSQTA